MNQVNLASAFLVALAITGCGNGEPAESLGGHVDLTRPLSFIKSEVAS